MPTSEKSLRLRSLLLMAAIFLFIGCGAFVLFEEAIERIVIALASQVAEKQVLHDESRIGGLLNTEVARVSYLTRSPLLRDWLEHEDDPARREMALRELEGIFGKPTAGYNYDIAVRKSLHYYSTTKTHPRLKNGDWFQLDMSNPADAWFARALKNDKPVYLDLEVNPSTRVFKVWINVLIHNRNQEVIGIAGSGIDLSVFLRDILGSGSQDMQRFLISATGEIRVHPRREFMRHDTTRELPDPGTSVFQLLDDPAHQRRLRGAFDDLSKRKAEVVVLPATIYGRQSLLGVAYLPAINCFVLTVMDTEQLLARSAFLPLVSLLLVALLLTGALVLGLFNRMVLSRIKAVDLAARQMALGNYEISLPTEPQDEIGRLSDQFQRMARAIRDHTANMEERIALRTVDLQQSNAALNVAYEAADVARQQATQALADVREAQTQLIQSEKMATLGQLVANVAHEINTPIGAIKSSSASITETLGPVLAELIGLIDELTPPVRKLFLALLERAMTPLAPLSTREERACVKALSATLADAGVADAQRRAGMLMQMNVADRIGDFLPLLRCGHVDRILATVHALVACTQSAANINIAVAQVSKIVTALKFFSRLNAESAWVPASLAEGLNTVLVIYQSQIRKVAQLVKQFDEVPPLLCHPDELVQVWTNLIQNALQAMQDGGTLTLSLRQMGDDAVVAISDTGSGMTPEIQSRIFDPFFTTKPIGEGSGLGLDIVRRLVEHHHGRIEVRSAPGQGSTFTVYLPINDREQSDY